MHKFNYFVPTGYSPVDASFDKQVMDILSKLKGVEKVGAQVPNSALSIKLLNTDAGAFVELKKREKQVYINICCVDQQYHSNLFALVEEHYRINGLGIPRHPPIPTWIHSIPIAHDLLRANELYLCQKMTVCLYYVVYGKHINIQNRLN